MIDLVGITKRLKRTEQIFYEKTFNTPKPTASSSASSRYPPSRLGVRTSIWTLRGVRTTGQRLKLDPARTSAIVASFTHEMEDYARTITRSGAPRHIRVGPAGKRFRHRGGFSYSPGPSSSRGGRLLNPEVRRTPAPVRLDRDQAPSPNRRRESALPGILPGRSRILLLRKGGGRPDYDFLKSIENGRTVRDLRRRLRLGTRVPQGPGDPVQKIRATYRGVEWSKRVSEELAGDLEDFSRSERTDDPNGRTGILGGRQMRGGSGRDPCVRAGGLPGRSSVCSRCPPRAARPSWASRVHCSTGAVPLSAGRGRGRAGPLADFWSEPMNFRDRSPYRRKWDALFPVPRADSIQGRALSERLQPRGGRAMLKSCAATTRSVHRTKRALVYQENGGLAASRTFSPRRTIPNADPRRWRSG
jgi:hypothetical protein